MNPRQTSKEHNEDSKIYVGRSTTKGNLSFFAYTQCINYVSKTFLLVSSSVRSKQLLCFVHDERQESEKNKTKQNKNIQTKNFSGFHNHSLI